jgi:hypothetical protein
MVYKVEVTSSNPPSPYPCVWTCQKKKKKKKTLNRSRSEILYRSLETSTCITTVHVSGSPSSIVHQSNRRKRATPTRNKTTGSTRDHIQHTNDCIENKRLPMFAGPMLSQILISGLNVQSCRSFFKPLSRR